MKDLIIIGKAAIATPIKNLKNDNTEIWMLGTDTRNGGDIYFELHNITIKNHDNVIYNLPDSVYSYNLPINNSISALLVYAWLQGFKNIRILGCPMNLKVEYTKQKPALGFVIGWLSAHDVKITWSEITNINYGKKSR